MRIFADLHLHSRYSRGTSRNMSIENLEKYARIKGLNLLGTADFTHPLWLEELKEKLNETGDGILKTATGFSFILQTEVSNVFEKNGKRRAVHNIVFAPDFETAEQVNEALAKHGDLKQDGRPTIKLSCAEMVEVLREISNDVHVVPAHAWTPWYGIFGSKSGFDSLKDAFEDQVKHIFAIETGLSSDPAMNWRVKELDNISLISNSDSHSYWPWRIGRECNVFELKSITYRDIFRTIKSKEGFLFTIEFYPEEGKYHWDGHRKCKVSMHPKHSAVINGTCPACKKPLTVGVLHRVEQLASREENYRPERAVPFIKLVPLAELIAMVYSSSLHSRKVIAAYFDIVKKFGNEFRVLLEASEKELMKSADQRLACAIIRNREQRMRVIPGYDGVYGKIMLNDENEDKDKNETGGANAPQRSLLDF